MLRLLRLVSVRDYQLHLGRLGLIVAGIATGVALIAALDIINASVVENFRAMLTRAAGAASLQVVLGTGEVGFPASTAEIVARDPDVAHGIPLVRGTLVVRDDTREVLQLFGLDLTDDTRAAYDVELIDRDGDDLELLNDPEAVLLTEEVLQRRGVALRDRIAFATPTGNQDLRVRGTLRAQGLATLFGGALAVMDLYAAQRLLGKESRIDQVDVVVRDGADVAAVQRRLAAQLPESLSVVRPALRGEWFERVVGAFQALLDTLSMVCLLAGVFIVYNTTATAITQRARDLAVLVVLGIERRTIFLLVTLEAALLGLVASSLGILAGYGLAHLLLDLVAQSMGVVYQMRFTVSSFVVTPAQVATYLLIGTAGAVIAAIVPARKASALDPLELLRPDAHEHFAVSVPTRKLLAVWALLIALTAIAVVVEVRTWSAAWGTVAHSLWLVSAIVLAIPLMTLLSSALSRALPTGLGPEGRIAVEGLRRSPGRTGVTTAVIALSLTTAVAVASVARSFRESERNWFILTGDLVVSAVATQGGWLEMPLSAAVGDLVRRIPGVARVETYHVLPGQAFRDARIAMVSVSPGFVDSAIFRRQVVDGDPELAVRAVRDGSGVVISDNLAARFGLEAGDAIVLPTPAGTHQFPIVATVSADYSGDQGSVLLGRDRFVTLWGDDRVSHFNVFLAPGASGEDVRRAIVGAISPRFMVKVLTVPATLAYHQGMVDRAFVFTYAVQLLVVAVTLAGILDLLITQIIERRREIGLLRVVGTDEFRIARAIRWEAVAIGACGALLGTVLGIGTSLVWVHLNFRILIGYVLEHHFAFWTAVVSVSLAALVARFAGQVAGRRALRQPVLESLRVE